MIAQTLISIARSRLGDEAKHRWTDDRLLTITDQGQKDFCKRSGVYRKITVIPLGQDLLRYPLPADTMSVNRIEYKDERIPLFSRNDVDDIRGTSAPFVGIKDNLNMQFIDLYKYIPEITTEQDIREGTSADGDFQLSTLFGVVTDVAGSYELSTPYGVVTGDSYDRDTLLPSTSYGEICDTSEFTNTFGASAGYGVTVGMEAAVDTTAQVGFIVSSEVYEVVGGFGVTTDVVGFDGYIRVFYTAIPAQVNRLAQELVLQDMWEAAMVHYIVGTALQDDNDANNIQRGELELTKFMSEVAEAEKLTAKDFSRGQPDKMTTSFRSI